MPEKKLKEEDEFTTDIDSKYRLVLLAAKRSKQLQKGARPRVQSVSKKPTRVALEEVERRLVRYQTVSKEVVER
jgi:DNA-directed RNA polymerase subunit omega